MPAEPRPARAWRAIRGRRAFLATLAAGSGALALRFALLPRPLSDQEIERLAQAAPDELDYDLSHSMPNALAAQLELGPIVTRWQHTFRINTVERDPRRGADRWRLAVDGLAGQPATYDKATLDALGRRQVVAPFQCVEGWGLREVRWSGVPLVSVLERARPGPDARCVTFHTLGGVYTESLSLGQAAEREVLLADERDGAPLPERQGLPLRLVVPSMYGYKSAKWVNRIELTSRRHVGFWERRGWALDPYL